MAPDLHSSHFERVACAECQFERDDTGRDDIWCSAPECYALPCSLCHGEGAVGTGYSTSFVDPSDAMACPSCGGSGLAVDERNKG